MSKSAGKKPKETSDKTKEDNFVWSDDEVQLLLEVINDYKVLKAAPLGKALDKRDWRRHLTSAFTKIYVYGHTKTHKGRFQIYPLWRAFSNLCVYDERFHRLKKSLA